MLGLAIVLTAVAAPALAQVDYSGAWDLSATSVLPDEGGTCSFEGSVQISQSPNGVSGVASLSLVAGPDSCPMELMADLTGRVGEGDCIVDGVLLGGQLGDATFGGCPGDQPGSLQGSMQVTAGPFAGTTSIWTGARQTQQAAIPTLSAAGLALFIGLLLAAGAWLARGRLAG